MPRKGGLNAGRVCGNLRRREAVTHGAFTAEGGQREVLPGSAGYPVPSVLRMPCLKSATSAASSRTYSCALSMLSKGLLSIAL